MCALTLPHRCVREMRDRAGRSPKNLVLQARTSGSFLASQRRLVLVLLAQTEAGFRACVIVVVAKRNVRVKYMCVCWCFCLDLIAVRIRVLRTEEV